MTTHENYASQSSGSKAPADHWFQILVSNPGAAVIADGERLAVGHGLDKEGQTRLRGTIGCPERWDLVSDLVAAQEEATIVVADLAAPRGPTLEAWRGATSNFEAYAVQAEDGRPPMVADHFRNALTCLPPARRTLDSNAIADHLLFGTAPGTHTYLTAIHRLGHGEYFRWQGGQSERRLFDLLVAQPPAGPPSLDDIDAGLSRALGRLQLAEGCVNQLSGGVDSSLLQTYLPAGTPTVSGTIDSPEFERERSYAEQASGLLATKHQILTTYEREYQSALVGAIRSCGLPIHMPQTVVYQSTFHHPGNCFVNGQFADALFGLRPSLAYAVAFGQRR
jgi:hypothetical protein